MSHEFEPAKLVWDQLVLLNNSWRTYDVLYRASEETNQLLVRSARSFFQSHRRLLIRDILLAIARLTDQESTGGNRNLVLASILRDPALDNHPGRRDSLRVEIASLVEAAAPIRRHRHKYVAHLDHEVATGQAPPLPPVSWDQIDEIIRGAERVYHSYALSLGSDVSFELGTLGDARKLVQKLADAERWSQYSLRTKGTLPDDPHPLL